jgi:hypothetical protein
MLQGTNNLTINGRVRLERGSPSKAGSLEPDTTEAEYGLASIIVELCS